MELVTHAMILVQRAQGQVLLNALLVQRGRFLNVNGVIYVTMIAETVLEVLQIQCTTCKMIFDIRLSLHFRLSLTL